MASANTVAVEARLQTVRRAGRLPLFLVVSLFFLWGVANNLNDVLVAQFKRAFTLTDFQSGLVQGAFYVGYFLVAIPAGMFMRRYGYKGAMLFGLLLYGVGALLFWPAAVMATYGMFLCALFIIAGGLAFLETSANPLVTLLGSPETAAARLNWAQAFNPLGSIFGVVVGQIFILSETTPATVSPTLSAAARHVRSVHEAEAVQLPYLIIGLVVLGWAVLIASTRFPDSGRDDATEPQNKGGALWRVLRNGHFMSAVVAQFFYVGAQVSVWSYTIRYVQATMPGTPAREAANFLTAALVCFMLGRFAGAGMMRYLRPPRLLAMFAVVDVLLAVYAALVPGMSGACALVACSFFMSVMYPTIFALGVGDRHGNERKLGSSVLVMAIIGGAVLTGVMGAVSDAYGIAHAMLVPGMCFVVVLAFARSRWKGRV
ncbi:L-fucose:H+ symporter permease [Dyella sp. A6]|uniref:L-fucose:H+ symporter permease n=1 Tax=Dyella aluminiiresistens TaxID=3069105 RepID=UPI002E7769D0|nr:L-fucose:H+ symporter permease [Dyella sp. A6]